MPVEVVFVLNWWLSTKILKPKSSCFLMLDSVITAFKGATSTIGDIYVYGQVDRLDSGQILVIY